MSAQHPAFAEIIESSIVQARGLCWTWSNLPHLGSLVKITQSPFILYGCIENIQTGSSDPLRQPFAYQKTEAELLQEQPQLFSFLQTTFTIKILGYRKGEAPFFYLLPPQPAKLHGFIEYVQPEECQAFFENPEFLNLFFIPNEQGIDVDELLLALLKHLQETIKIDASFIQRLCQYRASMQAIDYRGMKRFMQRLQHLL